MMYRATSLLLSDIYNDKFSHMNYPCTKANNIIIGPICLYDRDHGDIQNAFDFTNMAQIELFVSHLSPGCVFVESLSTPGAQNV